MVLARSFSVVPSIGHVIMAAGPLYWRPRTSTTQQSSFTCVMAYKYGVSARTSIPLVLWSTRWLFLWGRSSGLLRNVRPLPPLLVSRTMARGQVAWCQPEPCLYATDPGSPLPRTPAYDAAS